MKQKGTIVELDRLALSSGQASTLALPVSIEPVALGGQSYAPTADPVDARLDVSRTTTGHALRLRFEVELAGPCVRCLEEARFPLAIDAREVDQRSASDEELRSPYVVLGEARCRPLVQRRDRARDALAAALPPGLRRPLPGLWRVAQRRRPRGPQARDRR